MTMTEQHPQRERAQQQDASHDLAREHGNRIVRIAEIAEQQLADSEQVREDLARLEDGLQVLRWLATAPWSERTLEIDRVLHDEHGSLNPARVDDFIGLLLSGHTSLAVRHLLAAGQGRRMAFATATRRAVDEAREVAATLHQMAESPLRAQDGPTRPALPPVGPVEANGKPLPRREAGAAGPFPPREPIAPSEPPMFPPAPPESPAEQTGAMMARHVEAMRNGGLDVKHSQAALDQVVPVIAVDESFGPVSIPQQRDVRDTQPMRLEEVLGHLAMDDAGTEADEPEPRPFPEAGAVGESSLPEASRSGADGDD